MKFAKECSKVKANVTKPQKVNLKKEIANMKKKHADCEKTYNAMSED
jgi:hypothetical protein